MGTNLDIELKIRIKQEMRDQLDAVVASRPDGTNRSDIVREALSLHLAEELQKSGKKQLRQAKAEFSKAAKAMIGRIPKR